MSKNNTTKNVFIGGSRNFSYLFSPELINSLNTIANKNINVLIGDSELGIDEQIAKYYQNINYQNIIVHTIDLYPRINIYSGWGINYVNIIAKHLPYRKQQYIKDRKIINKANWGLIILNPISRTRYNNLRVSSATLRNLIQLLLQKKPTKLFYIYEGVLQQVDLFNVEDLRTILNKYYDENITEYEKNIILTSNLINSKTDAKKIKSDLIINKFNELLINETKMINVR